jgi:hypothetical protein
LIEQETAAWNFLQARAMTKFPSEIQDQIHFTGQNPNVKGMSKLKVQNIWHWNLGLWHLTIMANQSPPPGRPDLSKSKL